NLNVAMGSTQFGVSLALALGGNGLRDYWAGFNMPEVHEAAANRVRLVAEPSFGLGGRQAILEVRLKDGRLLQQRSEEPRGEPTNPLTDEEMDRKFLGMAGMAIDDAQAQELSTRLMALQNETRAAVIPGMTVAANGKPALRAA
ncbi:MAG TPA: MmgE/PrpD family protein, partial [Acetobacteraceae bacterium]|nr:MmgE/PrpD family protein [Acetobacteraceae bacterium]